jgi:hypothetical protein
MEKYRNIGGNSGVSHYEIGTDYINVIFSKTGSMYTYSYQRAGNYHVENMKQLAQGGKGLNTYINKHVKNLYD